MSIVNVIYQTSLVQFIDLFNKSMTIAEKSNLASKRVLNIIDSMTYVVYRYINMGLYERDKLLFVFLIAVKVMQMNGLLEASDVALFMRGGAALDINAVRKKPTWISVESWLNVIALSQTAAFFEGLIDSMVRNEGLWRKWYEDNEPEVQPIPDYETSMREHKDVGPWRRALLIRSLRVDRALLAVRQFLREMSGIGEKYVEPVTDTMESIYEDSSPHIPIAFLLSIGADPTETLEQLAKKKKQSLHCVSMGEGQEPVALKAINGAAVNGSWVLLQNCELGLDLMDRMEEVMTKLHDVVHADFRLYLTALPNPKFPLGLLQMSTKVTNEPPAGMRAGLLRSYNTLVDQDRLERIDTPQWRKLIYLTCFLHSVVQERRKFGPLGWCIPYEFGSHDASACLLFLERHIYAGQLSWSTVQYMVAEVQYGGKVTDNMDRRLFAAYASGWYGNKTLDGTFAFNPSRAITRIPGDFKYTVPDYIDLEQYRRFVSGFPETDNPEIYGLHPNADLTYRVKEASALLATLSDTQPKQASGAGGRTLDEVIIDKTAELLEKLPPDFVEEEYRARIRRLGGLAEPMNIFLYQEIQRFQAVIGRVRAMLTSMQQAIRGEVVMTSELLQSMTDMFDARVPRPWLFTPGGDEFSWLLPTLGMWFASLLERDNQLRTWLMNGRPLCYWMAGFSNPQGFLTAMKQEVTRMHKAQHWALDDVEYFAEVTDVERADNVKTAPKEGVYIQGLYVEGARWDKHLASLAESEPKKLYAAMPVLWITAYSKALHRDKTSALGPTYETPIYRYPARTERYRVLSVALPTKGFSSDHWIVRGASLLCITQ
jgi:dynein heavy chain